MSGPSPREIEEVFDAVADLPPERQLSEMERLSGGRAELRAAVSKLLRIARADAGGLLDRPAVVAIELEQTSRPAAMTRVGPYRVLSMIGEGGMGVVYEAEQQNPRRVVALKVIRPGLMTTGLIRRFEREAAALGLLQHSGIACVYEAGVAPVEGGTPGVTVPFIAMELVRGLPLIAFARERGLGVRQRADLVARLADAVQHAHERGVIHRDLKPANVLVDGQGQPKILDFGIAKLAEGAAADETRHTLTGQVMGTLEYMSPEQLSGDPTRIDARCDVYALGVILYELLAGKPPHEVREMSIPAAAEVIREGLVARLETVTSGKDLRVDADLSTIASRALEKDPLRRYASAGELAADLRRYLRDEPIVARPTTAMYQLRRFARRHRALVWGVAATVLALAVGLVGMAVFAARESRARVLAEERLAAADRQSYRASVAAAKMALEAEDRATAEHQLTMAPAAARAFEWDVIRRSVVSADRIWSSLHGARSASVLCDAGELVGLEPSAAVLDLARDAVVSQFGDDADELAVLQIHRKSGVVVLLAGDRRSLRLHELSSGALVSRIETSDLGVPSPRLNAEGTLLGWAVGRGQVVRVVEPRTGALVKEVVGSEPTIALEFQPGTRRVAMSGSQTRVVDVDSGAVLWDLPGLLQSYSGDGRLVAVTRSTATGHDACVLDASTGQLMGRFPVHDRHAWSRPGVVFSGDGTLVAAHDRVGSIGVFDTATMQEVSRVLVRAGHNVLGLFGGGALRSGPRLVVCHHSGTCEMWSLPLVSAVTRMEFWTSNGASAVAFSADGLQLARSEWGALSLLDSSTGRPLWRMSDDIMSFRGVAFDQTGTRVAALEGTRGLRVLDARTGAVISRWLPIDRTPPLTAIAWSAARGAWLVAETQGTRAGEAGPVGVVRVVDSATLEPGAEILRGSGEIASLSCNGRLMAALHRRSAEAIDGGVLRIADAVTGTVQRVESSRPWTSASFSGDALLAGTAAGDVVWFEGNSVTHFLGAGSPVRSIARSPDGRRLAAACDDGNVYMWNAEEPGQQPLAVLRAETEPLGTVTRFTSDGDGLMVVSPYRLAWFERRAPATGSERAAMPLAFAAASGRRSPTSDLDRTVVAALGDNVAALNSDAWGIAMLRSASPEARGRAVELAERANTAARHASAPVLNTLGLALYRAGQLDEALAVLERSDTLYERSRGRRLATNWYIAAMVHAARGDADAAQSAMKTAEALATGQPDPLDADSRNIRDEAIERLSGSGVRGR